MASGTFPCIKPQLCGVKFHRTGTQPKCMTALGGHHTPSASVAPVPSTVPSVAKKGRRAKPSEAELNRRKEARDKRLDEASQVFSQGVATLRTSEGWKEFLDFRNSFHNYSFRNTMLILVQKPDASQCAGYNDWLSKGRQVRKGERGLDILAYAPRKFKETNAKGEEEEKVIPRFTAVKTFDVSQTDPIPGKEHLYKEAPVRKLTGEAPEGMMSKLTGVLEKKGWSVSYEELPAGGPNGFADPKGKRVVVNSQMDAAQQAKTLAHETGHVMAGHTDDLDTYRQHRGSMEVEAEATAYMVGDAFGMDTSDYSLGYAATWAQGKEDKEVQQAGDNACKTAKAILDIVFAEDER